MCPWQGGQAQCGWEEGINEASDQRIEEGSLDPIKLCSWPLLEMDGLAATLAPPSGGSASCRSQTAQLLAPSRNRVLPSGSELSDKRL